MQRFPVELGFPALKNEKVGKSWILGYTKVLETSAGKNDGIDRSGHLPLPGDGVRDGIIKNIKNVRD